MEALKIPVDTVYNIKKYIYIWSSRYRTSLPSSLRQAFARCRLQEGEEWSMSILQCFCNWARCGWYVCGGDFFYKNWKELLKASARSQSSTMWSVIWESSLSFVRMEMSSWRSWSFSRVSAWPLIKPRLKSTANHKDHPLARDVSWKAWTRLAFGPLGPTSPYPRGPNKFSPLFSKALLFCQRLFCISRGNVASWSAIVIMSFAREAFLVAFALVLNLFFLWVLARAINRPPTTCHKR